MNGLFDNLLMTYFGNTEFKVRDKYEPFYVQNPSSSTNVLSIVKSMGTSPTLTIEKSSDGIVWETMGVTDTTAITANIPANGKVYLRCSTTSWVGAVQNAYNTIDCSETFNAGGNIMSLIYGSSFTGNETTFPANDTRIGSIFRASKIVSAENLILPADILTWSCYAGMFGNCTSLTTPPSELPARTLAIRCYNQMFYGCTSLTSAPEINGVNLADGCCLQMFWKCSSLVKTQSVLPATTLADSCYSDMFEECTSLTTAPALPATTLTYNCYGQMFYKCSSLVNPPLLPATILVDSCYVLMFGECSSLNTLTCLATDITADRCIQEILRNAAPNGVFYKNPSATWYSVWIPSTWTIENYQG